MNKKTEKTERNVPEIYKQTEFELMLEMISAGVWKTTNLSNSLHVDMDTVTRWKKMPDAIDAHRKAILKHVKRRTDVEKILKELELESEEEKGETQRPLVIIKHGDSSIEVAN